jgi:hypothetical protein
VLSARCAACGADASAAFPAGSRLRARGTDERRCAACGEEAIAVDGRDALALGELLAATPAADSRGQDRRGRKPSHGTVRKAETYGSLSPGKAQRALERLSESEAHCRTEGAVTRDQQEARDQVERKTHHADQNAVSLAIARRQRRGGSAVYDGQAGGGELRDHNRHGFIESCAVQEMDHTLGDDEAATRDG